MFHFSLEEDSDWLWDKREARGEESEREGLPLALHNGRSCIGILGSSVLAGKDELIHAEHIGCLCDSISRGDTYYP